MINKYRPDLSGLPQQDILGLRSDPQLSKDMTEAYANENGQYLTQKGLPVTPGTTYLAHFAGPQGAEKILSSDPTASVADILGPKVVAANPFLKNMKASDLQAWADKKMGTPSVAGPSSPMLSSQGGTNNAPPPISGPQISQQQPQLPAIGSAPQQPQPAQADAMPMAAPLNAPLPIQQIIRQMNMRRAFAKIPTPAGFQGFTYS